MGQKVNPVGFRVGVTHAWGSRWFAPKKNFGAYLIEDPKIREVIKKTLLSAIANARNNNGVSDAGALTVKLCVLDESVRMRRYWPTARGSAHPIARRMCHCKVILTDDKKEKK